jgi:hypothetical protein
MSIVEWRARSDFDAERPTGLFGLIGHDFRVPDCSPENEHSGN